MKRRMVGLGVTVLALLGAGAQVATANPTVTTCHSISVTVNDTNVSDAGCNVLPPQ